MPEPLSSKQRLYLTDLRKVLQDTMMELHHERITENVFTLFVHYYKQILEHADGRYIFTDLGNRLATLAVTNPMLFKGRRDLQNVAIDTMSKCIGTITMELRRDAESAVIAPPTPEVTAS